MAEVWRELGRFAPYKGVSNEITYFFLAQELTWTEQELESSEAITVHSMTLEEARKRILEQEVCDGQTLSGLLLLERYLRTTDAS